jgi:hypothetical protein
MDVKINLMKGCNLNSRTFVVICEKMGKSVLFLEGKFSHVIVVQ